ncbi:hypothetical protein FXE32_17610 [Vibrio cholerae]|uniref:hypothetical protein n=1 Tax=Vibrio cholerae TaxID=666 RepID=UPI0004E43685|nr:hypothetical protein [Vibrio cholerae]KFE10910.1 hypothetical protein DN36_201 [Vibrio cholerae]TXZ77496.1 hypothetical protein FXE32_17610 [Vibrio cholerae]GHZ87365.1 hypothetical protein VCSRO35_0203 [Vibrio cholerae]
MVEQKPLLIKRLLNMKPNKRWRYRFGAGHFVRLPAEVTLNVGDSVSGKVLQASNAYSHVLGSTTNSNVYFQLFPNNQSVEFRLATHDGYVGLWNDPAYSGYLGVEVEWTLFRVVAGYKLAVKIGGVTKDLGTLASESVFRFNTLGRGSFEGLLWDVKVNDGSVWNFPIDDGPAKNIILNVGNGGHGDAVSFTDSNWTRT